MDAKVTHLGIYARRRARGLKSFAVFLPEEYIHKIKYLAAYEGKTLGEFIQDHLALDTVSKPHNDKQVG